MAKKVFMSFDFETGKATLTGMTDEPIIKNIEDLLKNEDMWNIYYCFELPMGDNGEKWTFSWKQWNKKDQEFKLEQYYPFPKNTKLINITRGHYWLVGVTSHILVCIPFKRIQFIANTTITI